MNISFFNLCSDLFSIIFERVIQIRNNIAYVVARIAFVFCCTLNMGRCLRPIFPDYVISCDYGRNKKSIDVAGKFTSGFILRVVRSIGYLLRLSY